MDLYSGIPYWIAKNELSNEYNPLRENETFEVAVIGSGITGALVSDALCRAGIRCCVVDKRSLSTGSSCASTALLQYEIDVPLCRMAEMMPEADALEAYRSCLRSIGELKEILDRAGVDAAFEQVPSIFYASNRKGLRGIREEYNIRTKYGLPVDYLTGKELRKRTGIKAPGALANNVSAQVDAYRAAQGLLARNRQQHNLTVFTHTEICDWKRTKEGYLLTSGEGKTIACRYVVVAAGFEAAPFLPEKLMQLTTTFAIVSQPVDSADLWWKRSLIWETRELYLYIRTDDSNRILVGGEDININQPEMRKFLLKKKSAVLEKKFKKLFPRIPFVTEMAWAGTFSSTKDGLPLIGALHGNPRMLYALGYGGNGITFSVIASQILTKAIQGETDPKAHIFSPERESLR